MIQTERPTNPFNFYMLHYVLLKCGTKCLKNQSCNVLKMREVTGEV